MTKETTKTTSQKLDSEIKKKANKIISRLLTSELNNTSIQEEEKKEKTLTSLKFREECQKVESMMKKNKLKKAQEMAKKVLIEYGYLRIEKKIHESMPPELTKINTEIRISVQDTAKAHNKKVSDFMNATLRHPEFIQECNNLEIIRKKNKTEAEKIARKILAKWEYLKVKDTQNSKFDSIHVYPQPVEIINIDSASSISKMYPPFKLYAAPESSLKNFLESPNPNPVIKSLQNLAAQKGQSGNYLYLKIDISLPINTLLLELKKTISPIQKMFVPQDNTHTTERHIWTDYDRIKNCYKEPNKYKVIDALLREEGKNPDRNREPKRAFLDRIMNDAEKMIENVGSKAKQKENFYNKHNCWPEINLKQINIEL